MGHTPITPHERAEFIEFVVDRYKACQQIVKSGAVKVPEGHMFGKECEDPAKWAGRGPTLYNRLEIPDGSWIADIEPGSCIFALLAQEYRGCNVAACDRPVSRVPLYTIGRMAIGFQNVRESWVNTAGQIDIDGEWDVITMLSASPLSWLKEGPYRLMLDTLLARLSPRGTLILSSRHLFRYPFTRAMLDGYGAVCHEEYSGVAITR